MQWAQSTIPGSLVEEIGNIFDHQGRAQKTTSTRKNIEFANFDIMEDDIDGLVQERHHSIANALELRLFCPNPSI